MAKKNRKVKKTKDAGKPDKAGKADPHALPLVTELIDWAETPKKAPASDAWEIDDMENWSSECDRLCDLLDDDPRTTRQRDQLIELLDAEDSGERSDKNIERIKGKLKTIKRSLES
jgi:hypothetical protein